MATKTEGNTLEHDTISIERTGKSDSYLCNRLFETKQNTALHTKSFPGPDQDTITPVEAIKIDTMETTETSGLETTNASETTKPETTVTIEETYLQTLIAPFTPQSIHRETMISANQKGQETMPTYEAIHLETRRKTEGIEHVEIDMRKILDIEDPQTNIKLEPTSVKTRITFETTDVEQTSQAEDQKTRRTSKATKKKLRKKSDGIFEISDNQNSTLVLAAPKSGPSFAEKTEQKVSTETNDFKDVNQTCLSTTSNNVKQKGAKHNKNSRPPISTENGDENENDNDKNKTKPVSERRRVFNLAKHIVSIVLILMDSMFDWVQYSVMNERGNYSTVAEPRVTIVEFTTKCEGTEHIELIFLIFTSVASLLSVIQIMYIIYQMVSEVKRVIVNKTIIIESVETFVFLFFIELSQILLVMAYYDVCTLGCNVNTTDIHLVIVLNDLFSISKISWRFLTTLRCCTVHSKRPAQPQSDKSYGPKQTQRGCDNIKWCLFIMNLPFLLPFLPCILIYYIVMKCDCDVCHSKVEDQESAQDRWRCEKSLTCCILRLFPSRFPEQNIDACDCTCRKCLSREYIFKCCTCRCFPTKLSNPKNDVFECNCDKCMSCENKCCCCILHCCPTYLDPSQSDVCTCRCWECLSCSLPCKCCIFRCFPEYQTTQKSDWFECTCRECMSCERLFACCSCRCFPSQLDPQNMEIFECTCRKCLSCRTNCCCCIMRCFPDFLPDQNVDWFECTCCKNPRPSSNTMQRPQLPPLVHVITKQPSSNEIQKSKLGPISSTHQCSNHREKCVNFLVTLLILIIILLLLFYLFLLVVQTKFVFVCVENDSLMVATQEAIVQNYLKLFNV